MFRVWVTGSAVVGVFVKHGIRWVGLSRLWGCCPGHGPQRTAILLLAFVFNICPGEMTSSAIVYIIQPR